MTGLDSAVVISVPGLILLTLGYIHRLEQERDDEFTELVLSRALFNSQKAGLSRDLVTAQQAKQGEADARAAIVARLAVVQEEHDSMVVQTMNLEGYVGQLVSEVAEMHEAHQDLQRGLQAERAFSKQLLDSNQCLKQRLRQGSQSVKPADTPQA